MFLCTVLFSCLAASVMAERSEIKGLNTIIGAVPLASGKRVASDIYSGCRELQDGKVLSEGEVCVQAAFKYMTRALVDLKAEVSTALLSNTVNAVQPTKNNDSSAEVLRRTNERIPHRSEAKHEVHIVEHLSAGSHHKDGIAMRTNMRSIDNLLHVHTNGSHMTARFKKDISSAVGESNDPTQNHEFGFDGAQGLKMQLRWEEPREVPSGLHTLLPIMAYAGWFSASDSWAFVECDIAQGKMVLQGKLIYQDDGAGDDFETNGLIGCST